ncbi:MAG: PrsW family intramembrane metalloprotease [Bacilli bacterium]|nr:PrsW family intramembrane metalloprotease [Bacilli bacterium]
MEVLLVLSVLPSIILGWYIYKNDRLEKEPTPLLIKLLLGGLGSVILTLIISGILQAFVPALEDYSNYNAVGIFFYSLLFVGLTEEFCKWIFLKSMTWKNKAFGHIYDAIVYAVFVSLGFATIENILYVFSGGLSVAILRAIFSVPGHTFFGVFMGYFYGLAKKHEIINDKKKKAKYLILSIIVPALLHGIFDFCLFVGDLKAVVIYLIFVIGLYIYAFKTVKKISNINARLYNTFCSNCGTKVSSNYCPNCGNRIN